VNVPRHTLTHVAPNQALREIADSPATLEMRAVALDAEGAVYRSGGGLFAVDARDRMLGALGAVEARDLGALCPDDKPAWEFLADRVAHERLREVRPFERAIIQTLAGPWQAWERKVPGLAIRPLAPGDSLGHLPAELRREIDDVWPGELVFAGFIDTVAVSFSYSSSRTETLADISIDTLEAYRGRSIAAAVASALIDHLVANGLTPVWGAVEGNAASLRLAAKLGFRQPAGELFVCEAE
jgi:RimJ/RimL family protein N-acetyltransferase